MRSMTKLILCSGVAAFALAAPARAEWKPIKPIEFIATAGPGGGTDIISRTVQGIITKYKFIDQPIVVVNKGGGSGAEGYTYGKAMAGDPYKVVFGTSNDEQVTVNLRRLYRKGVSLLGYSGLTDTAEDQRGAMDTLLAMMTAGSLHIPVGDVLPLASAAEAHARILERKVEGKIVLDCQH